MRYSRLTQIPTARIMPCIVPGQARVALDQGFDLALDPIGLFVGLFDCVHPIPPIEIS